jgi:hypothetical protein
VRDLEALVVRRVLLAARGRLLEERWLRRVERVVRVLAVRWSVREVLGRLREDSCHGQEVLVKAVPVVLGVLLAARGQLREVRRQAQGELGVRVLEVRRIWSEARVRVERADQLQWLVVLGLDLVVLEAMSLGREVLERRREDLCHGQGVRDLEALVVRRVLLAARGRLLEERWLRQAERVVRVLAVRWSVREVLGRLREDSCHGQGVLVKAAPVAQRVLLAARGRRLAEEVRSQVEWRVRVLAVQWSVREVLGRRREDSCHGQGVLVKAVPVVLGVLLAARGRLREVRRQSQAELGVRVLEVRRIWSEARVRVERAGQLQWLVVLVLDLVVLEATSLGREVRERLREDLWHGQGVRDLTALVVRCLRLLGKGILMAAT